MAVNINGTGSITGLSSISSPGISGVPVGSASAPAFSFTGDTNTGIYSPGADQVAISTNGTQRLLIKDASQDTLRVSGVNAVVTADAIGSSYPGFRLASNGSILAGFDGDSGNSASLQTYGAQPLIFGTNSTERLRITSAGLVGVGTSSPSADLYVKQSGTDITAASQTVAVFQRSSTTGHSAKISIIAGNAATSDIHFGDTDDEDAGILQYNHTNNNFNFNQALGVGTTSPTYLCNVIAAAGSQNIFQAGQTGISNGYTITSNGTNLTHAWFNGGSEAARIDTSGRLGIGTSSPGAMLDIIPTGSTVPFRITSDDNGVIYKSSNAFTKRFQFFFQDNSGTQTARIGADISGANASNLQFVAGSGTTPQVTLNSSGQVGIGTTSPSDFSSGANNLVISGTGNVGITIDGTSSTQSNIYFADGPTGSEAYRGYISYDHSNDAMRFGSAAAQRACIDSSGRLLVGTSTAFNTGGSAQYSKLQIVANSLSPSTQGIVAIGRGTTAGGSITSGSAIGTVVFTDSAGGEFGLITCEADGNTGTGDYPGRLVFSTTADGASSPTERMRISQNGSVMFGKTDTNQSAGMGAFFVTGNSTQLGLVLDTATTSFTPLTIYNLNATNNGFRFYVKQDGGIGNFQANNVNLSDRNAKKDISPAADTWDCIKEWEIVNYRYKDQPDDADLNLGVIAQQVAESCPEVITVFEEAKDDQPEKLGVKEQQMYWMAIKALQEAQTRIETLEAEVAALKGA
jgi:hypothetical protein